MSDSISKEERILKVNIIDNINTTDFEQLKVLMEKFIIDTYIREDSRFCNLDREEQNRIINNSIEKFDNPDLENEDLTSDDIKEIEKRIKSQTRNMKEEITKPNHRYFALKDGDKVVAFQDVFIQEGEREQDRKIEGHIARSYTEAEYRRKGSVITKSGERKEGSFSKILIEDVKEWFSENGVTHEQIGAGENVFYNMETYIAKWGFIPEERTNGTIYMERDLNNPIEDKNILRAIFDMCVKNNKRIEAKTPQDIESEIEESKELETLPDEVKKRLVQVFLKDDERIVSTEQLGKETLKEQKDTGGKKVTEQNMSQQIRELGDEQKAINE